MTMMRHVAKIANTDQRCVVAFMQIPGRDDHALVIPVDNLPPRFEQAVMDVLKSPEGQQSEDFALALSRHLLPDTGQNIFETLHSQGRLVPVPVSQVLMMPTPNQPVRLTTILENLGRLPDPQTKSLMEEYAAEKFNPHLNNQVASSSEHSRSLARGLIVEAEMLEAEAKKKREQAYNIDGSLRPSWAPADTGIRLTTETPPAMTSEMTIPTVPMPAMPDLPITDPAGSPGPISSAPMPNKRSGKRVLKS